jgi:hypothetical protein
MAGLQGRQIKVEFLTPTSSVNNEMWAGPRLFPQQHWEIMNLISSNKNSVDGMIVVEQELIKFVNINYKIFMFHRWDHH